MRETVSAEGVNILIGAFIPLATFALFHMVTVFPLSWVYLTAGQQVPGFLGIEIGTGAARPRGDHRLGRAWPTGSAGGGC